MVGINLNLTHSLQAPGFEGRNSFFQTRRIWHMGSVRGGLAGGVESESCRCQVVQHSQDPGLHVEGWNLLWRDNNSWSQQPCPDFEEESDRDVVWGRGQSAVQRSNREVGRSLRDWSQYPNYHSWEKLPVSTGQHGQCWQSEGLIKHLQDLHLPWSLGDNCTGRRRSQRDYHLLMTEQTLYNKHFELYQFLLKLYILLLI